MIRLNEIIEKFKNCYYGYRLNQIFDLEIVVDTTNKGIEPRQIMILTRKDNISHQGGYIRFMYFMNKNKYIQLKKL